MPLMTAPVPDTITTTNTQMLRIPIEYEFLHAWVLPCSLVVEHIASFVS